MDQAIAFCGDTITHEELLQALNVVGTDRLFQFMDCVKEHDADKGLELINTLLQEGYDIQEYLLGLTEHLRNLYIAHESAQLYLVEASEETKKRYQQTAEGFSRDDLMRMLHIISEAQIKLKDASQPRIQFEIILLKLIHMERSEQLSELLAGLEELKKNSGNFVNASQNDSTQEKTTPEPESKSDTASTSDEQKEESQEEEPTEPNQDQLTETSEPEETESNPSAGTTSEPETQQETQKPVQDTTPEPAMMEEEVEEEDDFDIGAPALMTNLSKKAMASKKHGDQRKERPTAPSEEEETGPPKKVTVDYVKEEWPVYLESLKGDFPMLLHLQMERMKVVKVKGSELFLECDNQFAKKMVDEQSSDLQKKLKECVGSLLRFNVTVGDQEEREKPMSVYERFKQIQQKDPIIRDIVEIFGAELEY
jgi:DNA polymerase-3 subunit gamma/tau